MQLKYITTDGKKAVPRYLDRDKNLKIMGYRRAFDVIRVIDGRCMNYGELPNHMALEAAWWSITEGLAIAKGIDCLDLYSAKSYVRDRSETDALLETDEIAVRQIRAVCDIIEKKPTQYKLTRGEIIGKDIRLTAAERTKYKAYTMIAIDQPRTELKVLRKVKNRITSRAAKAMKRLEQGATPRTESLARKKPWKQMGMSRTVWYERGKPSSKSTAEIVQLYPDK